MLIRIGRNLNGLHRSYRATQVLLEGDRLERGYRLGVSIGRRLSKGKFRPVGRSDLSHNTAPRKSKADSITIIALLGLLFGGYTSRDYLYRTFIKLESHIANTAELEHYHQSVCSVEVEDERVLNPPLMPASILPGRPGNLTSEQQARLQELWAATLAVFGVHSEHGKDKQAFTNDVVEPPSSVELGQRQVAADLGHEKRKKNRMALFGRKNQRDSGDASVEHGAGFSSSARQTADSDDKYGQAKEFRHAIASQSPEDLRAAFWGMVKHDHPDGLLLRFLRARKWDVEKALVMMISTMHWRAQEMHVDDDVIMNGEGGALEAAKHAEGRAKKEGEYFLTQLRMGKSYLHGIDKEGRPMCFVRVRLHRQGEQSEASLERYTVYVIETARLFLSPSVDTAAIVFDMTGFSMANMDYTPVKFMIKCFEANYPESLGIVVIHKSPWIFQGIWSIIKGWLDPVVASKVHFTRNIEELEHYVSRGNVPKELGGDEDWAYSYVEPTAGENERMTDRSTRDALLLERETTVRGFESATLAWINGSIRSIELQDLQSQRDRFAGELSGNYWRIDPYIRARTLYDRLGIIGGDGHIEPYRNANQMSDSKNMSHDVSSVQTSADDLD